jgi:hypothetical protein
MTDVEAAGAERPINSSLNRRLISGVIGFLLTTCIVAVLVSSTQQRANPVLLDDAMDEVDDDIGRAGSGKVSDMLKQSSADLDKLEKFQDEQVSINQNLEDTIDKLRANFTIAIKAARTATQKMESSLTKINDDALTSALRRINASMAQHVNGTLNRLKGFSAESSAEIGSMSESFFKSFDTVRKRIVEGKSFSAASREKINSQTHALELAIGGYELLGAQKLKDLAERIEQLRSQLKLVVRNAEDQLNQTKTEIVARMSWGVGGARTDAEDEVAQTRSELQTEFDTGMLQLQTSITGLQSRSQADVDELKKNTATVQSQHAEQSKVMLNVGLYVCVCVCVCVFVRMWPFFRICVPL